MVDYGDNTRPEVLAVIPPADKVLEVGCWRGGFGAQLAVRGMEVWGIEPNPEAARIATRRLSKVIEGVFPKDAPAEKFDGIIFNDVLEHMAAPEEAMHAARHLLKPGGWVVASIPNIRHISVIAPLVLHGRFDYRDTGILDRTHLKHFTRATIRELFENTGYAIEVLEPINVSAVSGKMRVIRLLGKRAQDLLAEQYVAVGRH